MVNTEVPIIKELNKRKSVRAFSPTPIEPAVLDALWAAGRWAPSSGNKQDWHHYAFVGPAVAKLEPVLNRGNHWALRAPLVVASTRDTAADNQAESRDYGSYDVALSVMSMVVEAEHQGLRAHQMAGFKADKLRRVVSLPDSEEPTVITAFGYEGDVSVLDERTQEKEKRPRTRKPLPNTLTIIRV